MSSVTHLSFNGVLLNLYELVCLLCCFLLLISSFIPLWSVRTQGITSILLCLLQLTLDSSMLPILDKTPRAVVENSHWYLSEKLLRCLLGSFGFEYFSLNVKKSC